MKKVFLLLPVVTLLFACNQKAEDNSFKPGRDYGDNKTYALFMYNYPRVTDESSNGYQEKYDNALYLKTEIQVGELIPEPAEEPIREKYEFQGWYRTSKCEDPEIWDFAHDQAVGSTFLYAKWGTSAGSEYIEPEYVYPERIITDMNYKVTGILNMPLDGEGSGAPGNYSVNLTTAGINRLKASSADVSFAVNYERAESASLTSATYNEETHTITLVDNESSTWTIVVNDVTSTLNLKLNFPNQKWVDGFETKAVNYESAEYTLGNYHVAMMGSSSMENWATSTEDMAPIVSFNHGIGGTTVENWTRCLNQRLIYPYSPKAITYYVGVNNIINDDKTGTQTGNALKDLFDEVHAHLPNTHIFYVLINKLPNYANKQAEFDIANQMALDYASTHDFVTCVDAGVGLLKPNGLPHWGYFLSDGLHMSKYGYVLWGGVVKQAIMDYLG